MPEEAPNVAGEAVSMMEENNEEDLAGMNEACKPDGEGRPAAGKKCEGVGNSV